MKKDVKLYNAMFPLWMLMFWPRIFAILVLPVNFVIDSIVLCILMAALKIQNKKKFYIKNVWKVFLFGLLSDVAGAALMLAASFLGIGRLGDELYLTIPGLLISTACIFILNYFVTFKKCDKRQRFIMSLTFAIATAPYTFLVPSRWIYQM